MGMLGLFLQSFSSISLLGVLVVLLLVYVISKSSSQGHGQGPPGPMKLPVLGNLLQLDILRPYNSLIEVRWNFYVHFSLFVLVCYGKMKKVTHGAGKAWLPMCTIRPRRPPPKHSLTLCRGSMCLT